MLEYFHAWNTVFEGLPRPFWNTFRKFSDLKYAWENITRSELEAIGINSLYIEKFIKMRKSGSAFESFNKLAKSSVQILTIQNTYYPKLLRSMHNHLSPLILYIKGDLQVFKRQSLSIVGTRQMTSYGEIVTRQMIKKLSGLNFSITSGMAQGIDSVAHRSAIEYKIPTIAVLGYGISEIPHYKYRLAEQIAQNGLIISEYPPDLPAQKYHFPLRNRIIAGLSNATVVVEAGIRSGARITAQYALDQNRDVYAVPGNICNQKSKGTNLLIQQSSAHPLLEPEDIFASYSLMEKREQVPRIYSGNRQIIIGLLKENNYSANDLLNKSSIPASQFNTALTQLELEGSVEKSSDGKYFIT